MRTLCAVWLCGLLAGSGLLAQEFRGTILGRVTDSSGGVIFAGGGLIPDDKARAATTPPGWVCNGGDPYAMWTLPGLPRLDSAAMYTLVVRVNVERPSPEPLQCPLRVNVHSN